MKTESGSTRIRKSAWNEPAVSPRPAVVGVAATGGNRHEQAKPDDGRGGPDRHHREREDLAVAVPVVAREGDQRQVRSVEHDLEREQDDQWAAPDQDPERPRAEEEG